MNATATPFDLEAFHDDQHKRLCDSRLMRPLEGRLAQELGRELRGRLPQSIDGNDIDAASVLHCFASAPDGAVQSLFHALTFAVNAAKPLSASDADWVCELVVYAAVRCIDPKYWLGRETALSDKGASRARVTLVESSSALVAAVGLEGRRRMRGGSRGDVVLARGTGLVRASSFLRHARPARPAQPASGDRVRGSCRLIRACNGRRGCSRPRHADEP